MPEQIFKGPVEFDADLERGVLWINDGTNGVCRLRICNIKGLKEMVERCKSSPVGLQLDFRLSQRLDTVREMLDSEEKHRLKR